MCHPYFSLGALASEYIQASQQKDPFASNFPLLGETMRANTTTMYEDDVFFDEAAV